jgi:hypothetical protein
MGRPNCVEPNCPFPCGGESFCIEVTPTVADLLSALKELRPGCSGCVHYACCMYKECVWRYTSIQDNFKAK